MPPAVATYDLRETAKTAWTNFDVVTFIEREFYVDDGLTIFQAIVLMKGTQEALLSKGNVHLHKIASNKEQVMNDYFWRFGPNLS